MKDSAEAHEKRRRTPMATPSAEVKEGEKARPAAAKAQLRQSREDCLRRNRRTDRRAAAGRPVTIWTVAGSQGHTTSARLRGGQSIRGAYGYADPVRLRPHADGEAGERVASFDLSADGEKMLPGTAPESTSAGRGRARAPLGPPTVIVPRMRRSSPATARCRSPICRCASIRKPSGNQIVTRGMESERSYFYRIPIPCVRNRWRRETARTICAGRSLRAAT